MLHYQNLMAKTHTLNINTDRLEHYAATLEKLGKNEFPVAAARALNSAALQIKEKEILDQSKKTFIVRDANFFKSNSSVEKASYKDGLNNMQATVGFLRANNYDPKSDAVKNLEKQEHGGTIKNRAFIPLSPRAGRPGARGKKGLRSKVTPTNRLSALRGGRIVMAEKMPGKNRKERLKEAANVAGKNSFVLSENGVLFKVKGIREKNGRLNLQALYSVKGNRSVKVDGTGFMRKSSNKGAANLNNYFEFHARKQINEKIEKFNKK